MISFISKVVDDSKITTAPPLKSIKAFIVRAEWFWSSIQYETRQNESEFKLDDAHQQVRTTNCTYSEIYVVKIFNTLQKEEKTSDR